MSDDIDTSDMPLPEGVKWKDGWVVSSRHVSTNPFGWNYGWVQGSDGQFGVYWAPYEEPYPGYVDLGVRFSTAQEAAQYLWLKFLLEGKLV